MEWVCVFIVIGAMVAGILAYRNQSNEGPLESDHPGSTRQRSLPSYVDVPLDARLASPEWNAPIAEAGFDPPTAKFVRVVGAVTVSSPSYLASDGMPFTSAATGILIVQDGRVGIAIPDGNRIVVVSYDNWGAELNVGNTGILKLVWANRTHGIIFFDTNAETPEGREFGNALLRCIRTA